MTLCDSHHSGVQQNVMRGNFSIPFREKLSNTWEKVLCEFAAVPILVLGVDVLFCENHSENVGFSVDKGACKTAPPVWEQQETHTVPSPMHLTTSHQWKLKNSHARNSAALWSADVRKFG